jgi:hypothetical protein
MIELIITPSKTISVDVISTLAINGTAEQTEFAVEDGSTRSDHKIQRPLEIEIEIAQTEHPIYDPQYGFRTIDYVPREVQTQLASPFLLVGGAVADAARSIARAVFGGQKSDRHKVYKTDAPRDRGGELQDELLELLNSESDLVALTLKGKTYPRMSLIGLSITGAPSEAGLTRFRCSFRQIRIERLETVVLPNPEDLAFVEPKSAGKSDDKGKGADSADKVNEKPKSLLRSLGVGD